MAKRYNYSKGKTGEDIAASYLTKQGFEIIEKNFHNRFGEIDLIAIKDNVLHFVEVKLKVGERFGTPEEMINNRKIWQVQKTAEAYLLHNKKLAKIFSKMQIDAICVVMEEDGSLKRLDYYENLTVLN